MFRVLSRFFGIDTPVDSSTGKKIFTALAETLLDKKQPGIYNQAIMDFGAVVCKPQNPLCSTCPLKARCIALLQGRVNVLPVKTGKLLKKQRWFYYLIIGYNGKVYVRKRGPKEIWENLYEFVLLEADRSLSFEEINESGFFKNIIGKGQAQILHVSKTYKQLLTHQTIHGSFIQLNVKAEPSLKDYRAITYKEFKRLPFPKFITAYLAENELKTFER